MAIKPTTGNLADWYWWQVNAPVWATHWNEKDGTWFDSATGHMPDPRFLHPRPEKPTKSALDVQEGGSHYKSCKIQPVEYIHANGLGYFEGCVLKYITRWKDKNGVEDLKKARHFLALLIELEEAD